MIPLDPARLAAIAEVPARPITFYIAVGGRTVRGSVKPRAINRALAVIKEHGASIASRSCKAGWIGRRVGGSRVGGAGEGPETGRGRGMRQGRVIPCIPGRAAAMLGSRRLWCSTVYARKGREHDGQQAIRSDLEGEVQMRARDAGLG